MSAEIDRALLDPYLPRFYRTYYNILRACDSDEPERLIQNAKDGVLDMRRVLEAGDKSQAYIDEYVAELEDMIETVEYEVEHLGEEDDTEMEEAAPLEEPPSEPVEPAVAADEAVDEQAKPAKKSRRGKTEVPLMDLPTPPASSPGRRVQPSRRVKKTG